MGGDANSNNLENASDKHDSQVQGTNDSTPQTATLIAGHHEKIETDRLGSADKHWLDYTIAIFAFIAALGGAAAAIFSGRQVTIANQALVASNRPWISVAPQIVSGLSFSDGNAFVTIEYDIKNVGHSPADVGPYFSKFYLRFPDHMNVGDEQRAFCAKSYAVHGTGKFGFTIFPDETNTSERVQELMLKQDMGVALERLRMLDPVLLGCVYYRFGLDQQEHQTGFIRHLRQIDSPTDRIDPSKGDIPRDRLVLDKIIAPGPAD